jgi:hypothetical protein
MRRAWIDSEAERDGLGDDAGVLASSSFFPHPTPHKMKAPRALTCLLLGFSVASPPSIAAPAEPAMPLPALVAAAARRPEEFAAAARAAKWPTPAMPSAWHVERVAAPESRPALRAARGVGSALARGLAAAAPQGRALPADDALLRHTAALCDVAEWCAATEGYGNALLAQRALDLAAVGVARLAAEEKFPLEKILPLAARLRGPGADAAVRRRILNTEAGAALFAAADQADLERTWAAGARGGGAHADFFRDERPGPGESATLAATWERKWHQRLVDGLEPRSAGLALALVEFRRATGGFPRVTAPVPPAASNATAGNFQLVLPVRAEPAGRRAFQTAWAGAQPGPGRAARDPGTANLRVPNAAWAAFDAVRQGEFLDQESRGLVATP